MGFIPEIRLMELLSECDAVLAPYEEFNSQSGVSILTCLSGRSLICTYVGGIRDLIDLGVDATVIERPVSPQSITAAVMRYEEQSVELRRAAAVHSRKTLYSKISWPQVAAQYNALFDTQLKKGIP